MNGLARGRVISLGQCLRLGELGGIGECGGGMGESPVEFGIIYENVVPQTAEGSRENRSKRRTRETEKRDTRFMFPID